MKRGGFQKSAMTVWNERDEGASGCSGWSRWAVEIAVHPVPSMHLSSIHPSVHLPPAILPSTIYPATIHTSIHPCLQDVFTENLLICTGPNTWSVQSVSSVAQSCPTLCDPMNRSSLGLPVHHQLPEFTQTH